jgi:hypothetical protein
MSTRSRRWLFAVLALAAVAGAGIMGFLALTEDEWEAARRRVPLGADREAVEAAVGKAADGVIGQTGRTADLTRGMPLRGRRQRRHAAERRAARPGRQPKRFSALMISATAAGTICSQAAPPHRRAPARGFEGRRLACLSLSGEGGNVPGLASYRRPRARRLRSLRPRGMAGRGAQGCAGCEGNSA